MSRAGTAVTTTESGSKAKDSATRRSKRTTTWASTAVWPVHLEILRFSDWPTRRDSNVLWMQRNPWARRDRNRASCRTTTNSSRPCSLIRRRGVCPAFVDEGHVGDARTDPPDPLRDQRRCTTSRGIHDRLWAQQPGIRGRLRYEIRREFAPCRHPSNSILAQSCLIRENIFLVFSCRGGRRGRVLSSASRNGRSLVGVAASGEQSLAQFRGVGQCVHD